MLIGYGIFSSRMTIAILQTARIELMLSPRRVDLNPAKVVVLINIRSMNIRFLPQMVRSNSKKHPLIPNSLHP